MASYAYDGGVSLNGAVTQYLWELTSDDHTGDPVKGVDFADRTVTAVGTWGGASVTIEGSNDGEHWMPLSDAAGAADAIASSNKAITIVELTRFIRPRLTTAGTGAAITVCMLSRNAQPLRG